MEERGDRDRGGGLGGVALAVGGERGQLFKQMGEMKKKIQLVEGERKAIFEDCENEKKDNKERVKRLKEEIKQLQTDLRESSSSGEPILKLMQEKKGVEINMLKKKSGEETVEQMDFKVADLRKKLNKMRFETKKKADRINHLLKEYEKVVKTNAEIEKAEEILEDSEEGQRLRFLENEIHKTNLKLMEGETIRKKYNTILDMLKKERLTFGNQLESLEGQLTKQEDEIVQLRKTHASALQTRESARQNQHRKEIALMSESKDREKRLVEYRRTAEERKNYFESMERHMFAPKSSIKETSRESVSTSDHARDDGRGSEDGNADTDGERSAVAASAGLASAIASTLSSSGAAASTAATNAATEGISEEKYEDAFSRMKKAAGVSDIDEVVRRFQTQEETAKHLHELQARSEKEIRDLGAVKEKLEAEWEVVKYMGQEENTELREKMEDLEEKIADEQCRKKSAEERLQSRNKLLVGIREGLDRLTEKLFLNDNANPPSTRNSIELLSVATERLRRLMKRLENVDLFVTRMEMEDDDFTPVGLDQNKDEFGLQEEKEAEKKDAMDSGPEEEEVPTRGYLKRQANLMIEAKSRSKRGNRRR